MITPLGWLERVPTYKEQQENLKEKDLSTYGFLGYPRAAGGGHPDLPGRLRPRRRGPGAARGTDSRDRAPVQHVLPPQRDDEFSRATAAADARPKLPGTDGRKMSKSYGNTILLTDPEPVVRQKLKTMVTDPARVRRTDPGNPDVCPVGDLHKIFSDRAPWPKVDEGCRSAGIGCIECKGWAADALVRSSSQCRSDARNMRTIHASRGISSKPARQAQQSGRDDHE